MVPALDEVVVDQAAVLNAFMSPTTQFTEHLQPNQRPYFYAATSTTPSIQSNFVCFPCYLTTTSQQWLASADLRTSLEILLHPHLTLSA